MKKNFFKNIYLKIKERTLFTIFNKRINQNIVFDPLIYSIEGPKYHELDLHGKNNFRGWVFYFGKKVVSKISVYYDSQFIDEFPVDLHRDDVGMHVPYLPASYTSGFNIELKNLSAVNTLYLKIVYNDGTNQDFLEYDIQYIARNRDLFKAWSSGLDRLEMPDESMVFLTQGHCNVLEYKNSILPSVLNIHEYLIQAGVQMSTVENILDFGCGSGRILKGWHITHPWINLHGCDYNPELTGWCKKNLPEEVNIVQNNLDPPTSFSGKQFDFIYLISVFTHLSIASQKRWIIELERILRPEGILMITLHGEFYVRNTYSHDIEAIEMFNKTGFISTDMLQDEGSNKFASYHSPRFVRDVFYNFDMIGYFPQGNFMHKRTVFKVALAQDVYVFRYKG